MQINDVLKTMFLISLIVAGKGRSFSAISFYGILLFIRSYDCVFSRLDIYNYLFFLNRHTTSGKGRAGLGFFWGKIRFSVLSYVFFPQSVVPSNGKDRTYKPLKLPSGNEYRYFSPIGVHLVRNMDI